MKDCLIQQIPNWMNGQESWPSEDGWLDKFNPHTGELLSRFSNSGPDDVYQLVGAADAAYPEWSEKTPVERGRILASIVSVMKKRSDEIARCIALETGKPPEDALNEVKGSILQGEYWASEGMRLYGRSLTSGMTEKSSFTVRQPIGVAALIVPANTPIANITWKAFPALLCGNSVVLKAAEDAPETALLFARLTREAGLPDGVLNVLQGHGQLAGAALVNDHRISIISFTGSTAVGRSIAKTAGQRLARVSLELGGKNPFIVCDDADLECAVHWASLSGFSNAGQRCASGSRIILFETIFDEFREKIVAKAESLKLGTASGCDLGPVINKVQQSNILAAIQAARESGCRVLCGGVAPVDPELADGYYIRPTVIDSVEQTSELNYKELFGPVVTLHSVVDLNEALEVANSTEYGLTAAIHTQSVDRAMWFAQKVRSGIANVNLGTFGSEPHMPFGGLGSSGNGTREPGVEALDVYSELKNISFLVRRQFL